MNIEQAVGGPQPVGFPVSRCIPAEQTWRSCLRSQPDNTAPVCKRWPGCCVVAYDWSFMRGKHRSRFTPSVTSAKPLNSSEVSSLLHHLLLPIHLSSPRSPHPLYRIHPGSKGVFSGRSCPSPRVGSVCLQRLPQRPSSPSGQSPALERERSWQHRLHLHLTSWFSVNERAVLVLYLSAVPSSLFCYRSSVR